MLILSRKKHESVVVTVPPSTEPTKITVTVADIRGDKVRIGFTAPRESTINRAEVEDAKERGQSVNGRIRLLYSLQGETVTAPEGEYAVRWWQGAMCVEVEGQLLAVNQGDFEWVEMPVSGRGI